MADPYPNPPTARDVLVDKGGTPTRVLSLWMEQISARVFPKKFLPTGSGTFLNNAGEFTAPSAGPVDAQYVVAAANSTLTAERVTTASTSITWNTSVAAQIAAERAALTGDVTASANSNATTIAVGAVTPAKLSTLAATETLTYQIDGGGAVIATGKQSGVLRIPYACTIVGWWLFSSDPTTISGSIVLDLWKDVQANYPPTIADTITAAAKPTITTATFAAFSALTGWTTSCAAGDVIIVNVDSVTDLEYVTLELVVTRA